MDALAEDAATVRAQVLAYNAAVPEADAFSLREANGALLYLGWLHVAWHLSQPVTLSRLFGARVACLGGMR